jgi:arylsulfatase A-like enzyme
MKAKTWFEQGVSESDRRALKARYDQELAYTDAKIGDLMNSLRERGAYEDTIVMVLADHGEEFLEHGGNQHGDNPPYDEVIRVPLVIRFPAAMRPQVGARGGLVGLVDVMPTLLDLAGLPVPEGLRGRSLRSHIYDRAEPGRDIYVEGIDWVALRTPTHKLMVPAQGDPLLFDLVADPGEKKPIPPPLPPEGEELERRLSMLVAGLHATAEVDTSQLTEEELEELRSLGYIQ